MAKPRTLEESCAARIYDALGAETRALVHVDVMYHPRRSGWLFAWVEVYSRETRSYERAAQANGTTELGALRMLLREVRKTAARGGDGS